MNLIFYLRFGWLKYKYFFFFFAAFGFCGDYVFGNNIIDSDNTALLFVNHAPVFNKNSYSLNILEETALGSSAGTVTATDVDGDPLTYSIRSGNTNSAFSINSKNGSITVIKQLNHHTQNRFMVIVKVTDPGGLSNEAPVIINVQAGNTNPGFINITWGSATAQPYGTHEIDGGVVNGKLYIFGGFDVLKRPNYTPTKRAFVYDPIAKTWSPVADLPHTPNGAGFGGISNEGFATDGTDFYFAGGYPSNSTGKGQVFGTKQVWKYNVASNTYTALPGLPIELAVGQLRYLRGKLHYMGGANKSRRDTSVHYALNLDSLSAGWKIMAPLLNATNKAGSAVYEGKIYYISGAHFQNNNAIPQKTVQVYDPDTNTWTKVADLPTARDHITSSVIVLGDRILVLGGYTSPTSRSNLVSAYSPAGNIWKNLTSLPVNRASGVAGVLNGNLFYCGGNFTTNTYKGIPKGVPPIQKVDGFTLINADTDQPLQAFADGDTLNIATLPTLHLNIRANSDPVNVGSVQFDLSGPQNRNEIDNQAPYALFGDNGSGDYFSWAPSAPPLGQYTLKATPFAASGASGTAGTSKTIVFTLINKAVQNVTLSPVADAFVRNGSYAGINYGGDTTFEIKSSSSVGFTRYAYLKFSIGGINNIDSATLRLYGRNTTDTSGKNISVHGVDNDTWTENGINFSNAPTPIGGELSSTTVSGVAKYYEFNVTNFVKSQITGDKIVSLMLKDPQNLLLNFVFNSRENSQNSPQLIVSTISGSAENNVTVGAGNSTLPLTKRPANVSDDLTLKSKVFPNPMHKTFTIELTNEYNGVCNLLIIDPVGRIYELGKSALKRGLQNMVIDISKLTLKPGVYFLRINRSTKQIETIRLIVQ